MRFELTDPFGSLVFKTSAIIHSATLPCFGSSGRSRTYIDPLIGQTVYQLKYGTIVLWKGIQDSNLGMTESKSVVLSLLTNPPLLIPY